MIYINILFELPLDQLLGYSSVRFVRIFFWKLKIIQVAYFDHT